MITVSATTPATAQTTTSPLSTAFPSAPALPGSAFASLRCTSHELIRCSPPPPVKNARMATPKALKTPNAVHRVVITSTFVAMLVSLLAIAAEAEHPDRPA
jgi:hypothetical protein